jgi:anti-sigma B factor antagonist
MNIHIDRPRKAQIVVRLNGRLDTGTANDLKERLKEIAQTDVHHAVVDMSAVEFIDSSGLSALVSGLKALRAHGGTLSLCRPQPQALTALKLTMLDRVFSIFPTIEEALDQGDLLKP